MKAHVLTERYNNYLYQYTFINFEYNNLDLFITCYYTFGLWRVTIINFFPPFNLLSFYKCLVITGACSLYRTWMVLSFHNITFTKKLIILDFYHTISVYYQTLPANFYSMQMNLRCSTSRLHIAGWVLNLQALDS